MLPVSRSEHLCLAKPFEEAHARREEVLPATHPDEVDHLECDGTGARGPGLLDRGIGGSVLTVVLPDHGIETRARLDEAVAVRPVLLDEELAEVRLEAHEQQADA